MAITKSEISFRQELIGLTPVEGVSGQVLRVRQSNIAAGFWDKVLEGGGNILAFSDREGGERLPLEVISCDKTTQELDFYTNASTYAEGSQSVFVMLSKVITEQPATDADYGRDAVNSNSLIALRFQDTDGTITDSAGTSIPSTLGENIVFGVQHEVGRGTYLPNNEYVEVMDYIPFIGITSQYTLSFLVDVQSFSNWVLFLRSTSDFQVQRYSSSLDQIRMNHGGGTKVIDTPLEEMLNDGLMRMDITWQGDTCLMYIAGQLYSQIEFTGTFTIRSQLDLFVLDTTAFYFAMSDTVSSPSRIHTEYESQVNTTAFWTQGEVDDPSYVPPNVPPTSVVQVTGSKVAGDILSLDGSGSSDADEDELTFTWSLVSSPEGNTGVFVDVNAMITEYTPSVFGEYVFRLQVDDAEDVHSSEITVNITEPPDTTSPSITIQPAEITYNLTVGDSFTIPTGTLTDNRDDEVVISPTTNEYVDEVGDGYQIIFTGADNAGNQATPVVVTVNVAALPLIPPVADAGDALVAEPNTMVYLSAEDSTDTDGVIEEYLWEEVTDTGVVIMNSTSSVMSFNTGALASTRLFKVTVTDNDGLKTSSTVAVTNAAAEEEEEEEYLSILKASHRSLPNGNYNTLVIDMDNSKVLYNKPYNWNRGDIYMELTVPVGTTLKVSVDNNENAALFDEVAV